MTESNMISDLMLRGFHPSEIIQMTLYADEKGVDVERIVEVAEVARKARIGARDWGKIIKSDGFPGGSNTT